MEELINIAGIVDDSIVDGPGIRLTVFFQGCLHKCKNCHNPETWPMEGGYKISIDEIIKKLKNNPLLQGITLSGGDPLYQIDGCLSLAKRIKNELPYLDIILYTGFTFEEILDMKNKNIKELLSFLDVIIDGPYVDELRDLTLKFRGSSNQRIVNVQESIKLNKIVLINY